MSAPSEDNNESTGEDVQILSLEDQVIKYDMSRMAKEIEMEFDAKIYSQDLVDQSDIGSFFNLDQIKEKLDERN